MNKQKQKDLLKLQLDHQPKRSKWRDVALMVSIIAGIVGAILIFGVVVVELECQINWRELCG